MCNVDQANCYYNTVLDEIESMICLHYYAGSVYNNDFWDYAKDVSQRTLIKDINERYDLKQILIESLYGNNEFAEYKRDVGTWSIRSYKMNIKNLGIEDAIKSLLNYEK